VLQPGSGLVPSPLCRGHGCHQGRDVAGPGRHRAGELCKFPIEPPHFGAEGVLLGLGVAWGRGVHLDGTLDDALDPLGRQHVLPELGQHVLVESRDRHGRLFAQSHVPRARRVLHR